MELMHSPSPSGARRAEAPDLSIVIPASNEAANLAVLLPQLSRTISAMGLEAEILVVTEPQDAETHTAAEGAGAQVILQKIAGYGGALMEGIAAARGAYILSMDADMSHPPGFVADLWANRRAAEIIIASRYVEGATTKMPIARKVLSRVLNIIFARGLSLGLQDMSSGFRLYKAEAVRERPVIAHNLDVLQEILIRAYADGWTVCEIPFQYVAGQHVRWLSRVLRFGLDYLRTFGRLWKLRNSILAADYDDRAHDSPIFLQRYWQRRRFRHIVQLTMTNGRVLDVGCGSSRIIGALRPDSIALDVLFRKVRYARRFGRPLVHGSGFDLPFSKAEFPCVVCSQVIEHVPKESPILGELVRVLAPGGRLILGTPDYAHWEWVVIEKLYGFLAPGGYADEHIAHYTRQELIQYFESRGFLLEDTRYILRGEMILAFRKGV